MFKPIRMTDTTSYVSFRDPAIDWDAMIPEGADDKEAAKIEILSEIGKAAGKHPGDAEKLMKFKDGEQPTRFVIGSIDPGEMNRIQDECGYAQGKLDELRWRAFLGSLRKVENMPEAELLTRDGRLDTEKAAKMFGRGLRGVALEVGGVAWRWNQLTDDEARF